MTYSYNQNDVLETRASPSVSKQYEFDGLGRMTSVCEITSGTSPWPAGSCGQSTSATGYWTAYAYDPLDNLTNVTQNAQSTSNQQTRSYSYDMLSRLTSQTNPESNTTTYVYDSSNSNGCAGNFPGDLVQVMKASGQAICYYYDPMHRLTDVGNNNEGAPNSQNPCKRFRYDNSAGVLGNRPSGLGNGFGRLVEAETDDCNHYGTQAITDEWFGYDPNGNQTDFYQSTPNSGGYYHSQANYPWPNGAVNALSVMNSGASLIFPTMYYGASDGSGLDGEGRITKVTASSGTNPVSSVAYSPGALAGSLTGVTLGSGDSDSFTYDTNTGRPLSYNFSINGNNATGTMSWNTNGTLASLNIADPFNSGNNQNCSYGYDSLGRVSSVGCGSVFAQTFGYDPFGNIAKSGSFSFLPNYNPATNQFVISGANVQYDADGNMLSDNLGNIYTWSAYGNPSSINGINLVYNAQGHMVEQQNGSTYTQIVYSPMGKTAIMNGQTLQKAFVPLPGGGTAIYDSSGVPNYRHPDWLGSSRLTTTQSSGVSSSLAYAPFGEQYAPSGSADASFTGQNSDTISTLYDFTFREYSPSQGRWSSPDPAGLGAVDPTNPQTWNRYGYVANNPLAAIDAGGLEMCEAGEICNGGGGSGGGGGYGPWNGTTPGDNGGGFGAGGNGGGGCIFDFWWVRVYCSGGGGQPRPTDPSRGAGGVAKKPAANNEPLCMSTKSLNWSQKAQLTAAQFYANLTGWTFGFGAGIEAGGGVGSPKSAWNVGVGGSASTLIVADGSGNSGFLNSASGGMSFVKMSSKGSWWGAGVAAGPSFLVSPNPIGKIAGRSGSVSGGGGAVLGAGVSITTSGAATFTFGVGVGAEAGASPQFGTSQFIPFCKD